MSSSGEATDDPTRKTFMFNASSFVLNQAVEKYLRSKGAISLDFGFSAYINSEAMPSILSELLKMHEARTLSKENDDVALVAQLRDEVGRLSAEKQKIMDDNAQLGSQLRSLSAEAATLKEQAANTAKLVETLKAENQRLQAALKNTSSAAPTNAPTKHPESADDGGAKLKQSYEQLQKELQQLRRQNIEAITSLKVLEDENEELRQELEQLRKNQSSNNAPTQKADRII